MSFGDLFAVLTCSIDFPLKRNTVHDRGATEEKKHMLNSIDARTSIQCSVASNWQEHSTTLPRRWPLICGRHWNSYWLVTTLFFIRRFTYKLAKCKIDYIYLLVAHEEWCTKQVVRLFSQFVLSSQEGLDVNTSQKAWRGSLSMAWSWYPKKNRMSVNRTDSEVLTKQTMIMNNTIWSIAIVKTMAETCTFHGYRSM
jgi:hypothetical protein